MTRVWTEGAEMGDVLFFDAPGSTSANSSVKRSGAYSYLIGGTVTKSITGIAEMYVRFGLYISGLNTNVSSIFTWRNSTTVLGSFRFDGANTRWALYTSTGTLVATGTMSPQAATWYLIELHIKIADAGTLELKVDGIADASYSGDTKPGAATTVDNFLFGTLFSTYFDDLALNNVSGGVDDSWCGDGKVIRLTPDADGDSSQWTGSDGNSTSNYALVDEVPPNTTDYVEDGTSGHLDLYNLTACGLTNPTIYRVWAEARALDTVAAGGQIYLPIKTGGTQYDGTAVTLTTSYTRLLGDVYTTNPQAGGAWTTAQLDALQVGAKVV